MPSLVPGSATVAGRPALELAISELLRADRGDRVALASLRAHLRTLGFNDPRCGALVRRRDRATTLGPGVAEALTAYRGRSTGAADAWLNAQVQRVAVLTR